MKKFGDNLQTAALSSGFRRKEIADMMGVSERKIGYWWSSEHYPDAKELLHYAEITKKPILYFYGLEGNLDQTREITITVDEYNKLRDTAAAERARADQLEKMYITIMEKIQKLKKG